MISVADTLDANRIALDFDAADKSAVIREAARLVQQSEAVLDAGALAEALQRSTPCFCERGQDFGFCLPHARTDAVNAMVMSVVRLSEAVCFAECEAPVRYVFCIAVPKAMASDYLRIVGLLVRIMKQPESETALRSVSVPADFLDLLSELEAKL